MKTETTVKKVSPSVLEKEISTQILARIDEFTSTGEIILPNDYSPANALKGAMLVLKEAKDRQGNPVLTVCSKESIATAMLKMVVEGLSPLKSQGYFIPYGKDLTWIRSYQGSVALAKRVGGVSDVVSNVVYEGDDFVFQINPLTGYKEIVKHIPNITNISNDKIVGAYAVILYTDGRRDLEVMTIKEIETAWGQGATKGNSPAHKGFRQEMAKKTVINRACKTPINASSDAHLFLSETEPEQTTEDVKAEIVNETAAEPLILENGKGKKVTITSETRAETEAREKTDGENPY